MTLRGGSANLSRLCLYGTEGCHLCELAAEVVAAATRQAVPWQAIDIADDAALVARYGARIPVLRDETSGAELHWPFDTADVQRVLTSHYAGKTAIDPGT